MTPIRHAEVHRQGNHWLSRSLREGMIAFDSYVGKPLNEAGFFCADSRRRREYREKQAAWAQDSSLFSRDKNLIDLMKDAKVSENKEEYIAALTGEGALPMTMMESVEETMGINADVVSRAHVRVVDVTSAIKTVMYSTGGVAATQYFDLPVATGATMVAGLVGAKSLQAYYRNKALNHGDHWMAPVGYLDSPMPWAWSAVAAGCSAYNQLRGESDKYGGNDVDLADRIDAYQGGLQPPERSTFNTGDAYLEPYE